MKFRFVLFFVMLGIAGALFAQTAPQGFNYQSIVRNSSGTALSNQTVSLIFVLNSGAANGPVVYSERHTTSTNEYGLVNLVIGQGIPIQGEFNSVNWGGGAKFLTVSVETAPGSFNILGSSQLLSVPYALYAQSAGSGTGGGGNDNWGTQTAQTNTTLSGNGTGGNPLGIAQQSATPGQVLKWDGSKWTPGDDVVATGTNGGTVTQINTGTGLTGGPITASGTISLANSGVIGGTYGSATEIPVFSVDPQGRVTMIHTAVVQPGTVGINGVAGITVQQNGFNFAITNTGDLNGSDDVNLTTPFGGDLTGTYNDLQIKPNAVGSPELADNAVGNSELADNAVGTNEISANAVTTAKISNGAVTGAKIDDMSATNGQVLKWNGLAWAPAADNTGTLNLTSGSGITITGVAPNLTITNSGDPNANDDLTTTSTANGDVTGTFANLQIKPDVVGVNELTNNAVQTSKIANSAVTGAKIDDMGATPGQVLQWNGVTWAPANESGGTFTVLPGAGINVVPSGTNFVVTNIGDTNANDDVKTTDQAGGDISGTFSNLLINTGAVTTTKIALGAVTTATLGNGAVTGDKINSMSAAPGQVLKWTGSTWAPGPDNGGGGTGGDDWGSQTAVTDATLSGNGTGTSPLKLAQQGASNGQVLKWDSTTNTWTPSNDNTGGGGVGGDNWGTQVAVTGNALTGDGTGSNPLNLAKQGANVGQVLKWDGTGWTPAADEVGTGGGTGNTYNAGSGISITGTAPNFTINNTGDNDHDAANEIQKLSLAGNQLTLSNGGNTVTLPAGSGNNYTAGTAISITGSAPNLVINNTGDVSNTNELQAISLAGNNLTLSNGGGTVTLPSGGVGNTYTAGTGIAITGTAPNFQIKNTGDLSATNELQDISLAGSILTISATNSNVDLSPLLSGASDTHWKEVSTHLFNKNTGNVVIGSTVNNSGKLQVVSSDGIAGRFTLSGGSGGAAVYGTSEGSSPGGYFSSTAGPALVTSGGSVGIGLDNPQFPLDVKGAGHFQSNVAGSQLVAEFGGNDYARLGLVNAGGSWTLAGKGGNSGEFGINYAGNGPSATATRLFTLKSSGDVVIGSATNPASLRLLHKEEGLILENVSNNHNWEFLVSEADGSLALYNDQSGGVPAGTFTTGGLYLPSDRNLKKEIIDMAGGVLNKVLQLQPVTYHYKAESATAPRSMGFIAQDVQALFPELVTRNAVRNGQGGFLAVNYAGFGVLAVKSIQEQQVQIEALKQENEALRGKTEALEARLQRIEQQLAAPKKD